MIVLTFGLVVAFLQGDMIEDFIFGDLNRWGGVWHNWDYFMPPYTIVILAYLMMHFNHGDKVHGAWRHKTMSLSDSIIETGQFPLHWPILMY